MHLLLCFGRGRAWFLHEIFMGLCDTSLECTGEGQLSLTAPFTHMRSPDGSNHCPCQGQWVWVLCNTSVTHRDLRLGEALCLVRPDWRMRRVSQKVVKSDTLYFGMCAWPRRLSLIIFVFISLQNISVNVFFGVKCFLQKSQSYIF